MAGRISIFVSYAYDDKPLVERLVEALRARTGDAVDYVLDEQFLEAGESISESVATRIFNSQGVLLVLPSNPQGLWLQAEMAFALAKAQKDPNFKLLPVVTGNGAVPQLISDRLYVDIRTPEKFAAGVEALGRAVLLDRQSSPDSVQQAAKEMTMRAQSQALQAAKLEWEATKSGNQKSIGFAFAGGLTAALISIVPLAAEIDHLRLPFGLSFIAPAITAIVGFALGWASRSTKAPDKDAAQKDRSA
ncbi:TIR domain-containing protein [Sphingomonas gellani]|uniref:TIR domain-containing protein n=1 Tax=Sphingomonas gellani TaxID=1166340 RepID=A0A1H8IQ80_9SPHN|nr:toll/interleukin-1 receptor domain-containing protein [Sphingomonas gellani]SEN70245.1 TIR domain-containing protein [Sphingomonas gellani]